MKINEYGYQVINEGKNKMSSANYQEFETYPLRLGLPQLKSQNLALHYNIAFHGFKLITVKENNMSIHVTTNMYSNKDLNTSQWPTIFIAPFFIEKTKLYQTHNHTQFIFSMLFQKANTTKPHYEKGWNNHPYKELEAYCQKHFGLIDWSARTEKEAGR